MICVGGSRYEEEIEQGETLNFGEKVISYLKSVPTNSSIPDIFSIIKSHITLTPLLDILMFIVFTMFVDMIPLVVGLHSQ
jgi:hypothetical protein